MRPAWCDTIHTIGVCSSSAPKEVDFEGDDIQKMLKQRMMDAKKRTEKRDIVSTAFKFVSSLTENCLSEVLRKHAIEKQRKVEENDKNRKSRSVGGCQSTDCRHGKLACIV